MAKKPDITTIASGYYSRQALNTNFENLQDGFDNTLSLDGSTPNAMGADLDLNNNNIINAGVIGASSLVVNGKLISVSNDPVFDGTVSVFGADLIADADAATARTTLGLATVASTGSYNDLSNQLTGADTAVWELGTDTTEVIVSPAKVKAAIIANAPVAPLGKFHVAQQYTTGTTAGVLDTTWRDRALNTVVENTGTITASLDVLNKTVELAAGTYRIEARAFANSVLASQLRLLDIFNTPGTLARSINGCSTATTTSGHVDSLSGIFTFTEDAFLRLQHTAATSSVDGQGFLSFGGQVSTIWAAELIIERLS